MDEVIKPSEGGAGAGVEEQGGNPGDGRSGDTVRISDPVDHLAAVLAERDQLASEKAELMDRLMRRQAEFENFRKRVERERAEMLEFGGIEVLKAILPMMDDFERALETGSEDKEYVRGMELIYQRFSEALKKLGLEPMESKGKKFDPNLHHAVDKQETSEHDEDIVLSEYQRGYYWRGRLLRPAMVKVSVRP
jgi:molecular chaperone GrpE